MTRRTFTLLAIAVFFTSMVLGYIILLALDSKMQPDEIQQIRIGMTKKEAVAVMGRSPEEVLVRPPSQNLVARWGFPYGRLEVSFDSTDVAREKRFVPRAGASLLDRFLDWYRP